MDFQANYRRLCELIDDSLRPYTELERDSLNQEVVQDVLMSLSQVYRRIQEWTLEISSDSDDEMERKPADPGELSHNLDLNPNGYRCLAKIAEDLISLIVLENRYIQHLAGNTLVAVSEFLMASETGWHEFINLLCYCLKVSIQSTLSSSVGGTLLDENYNFGSLDSILSLKRKLETTNYTLTAAIIRVLRNVLKLLKRKFKNNLLKLYLDCITDAITNFPWDLLNDAYEISNSKASASSVSDVLRHSNAAQLKSIAIFHGHLLQLFCSLVGINAPQKTETVTYNHQVIYEIRSCIPKILAGCVGKLENWELIHISKYLRHKILMLMMRLSFATDLEYTVLVSWMHLIKKHFQDLLSQPLKVLESSSDDSLEGSPFWTDVVNAKKQRISSCHLQRLVILLFLRCSLTLVSMKRKPKEELGLGSSDSCLTFDINFKSCSSDDFSELQNWLQRHLPDDIFMDDETYTTSCMIFALSFLQLYMHEDDILFEMLLQMLSLPFCSRNARGGTSAAKNDIVCLVSDLFNPIHLFHLFLAEIHYDHQVLLDYLISRDTGDRCAEYLLRCLRLVCDLWTVFLEFPACEKSPTPLPPKRRKIYLETGFADASLQNNLTPSPVEMKFKDQPRSITQRLSLEAAKECLLSLKASIDSLNQKNLFPYNPKVLLRRLTRFQELSLKQEDIRSII